MCACVGRNQQQLLKTILKLLFYEDTPIYPTLPFSNFVKWNHHHPLPTHPTKPFPTLFVVLFLWRNGWLCHIWCVILLNDIMDLHVLSLVPSNTRTLWCGFCNKASVYWGWTYDVLFCYYSDLISHKQTKTHSTHRGQ